MLPKCGLCRINPVVNPNDWAYLHILNKNYKVFVCDNCIDLVLQFEREAS
jgi:hypothetical protein